MPVSISEFKIFTRINLEFLVLTNVIKKFCGNYLTTISSHLSLLSLFRFRPTFYITDITVRTFRAESIIYFQTLISDNHTDSEDSGDEMKTWLRNEFEEAKGWNPNPDQLKKDEGQVPKILTVKREGTIATLVTLPPEPDRRKAKKPAARKRVQTAGPVKSNSTPQRTRATIAGRPGAGGRAKSISTTKQINEMNQLINSMKV